MEWALLGDPFPSPALSHTEARSTATHGQPGQCLPLCLSLFLQSEGQLKYTSCVTWHNQTHGNRSIDVSVESPACRAERWHRQKELATHTDLRT